MGQKEFEQSLFIFRRDLRLQDNTALFEALSKSENVICVFIIDPRQVKDNPYKSNNAIQFMTESLDDLSEQLKKSGGRLYFFYGSAEKIIAGLITKLKVNGVFINRDYTPFSIKRDKAIALTCKKKKVFFKACDDALLLYPELAVKKNKNPYQVFTPFYKAFSKVTVNKPVKNTYKNYYTKPIAGSFKNFTAKVHIKPNTMLAVRGGRMQCLKILRNIETFKNYNKIKDFPAIDTSRLSAHNKFGTCSIREVFYGIATKLGRSHPLLRQLYWRDFFTVIGFYFPYVFKGAFKKKYNKIKWATSNKKFEAWCSGKTGFPIVDAGMRELNATGFMHNRVRMIVASFLVKDLHINWRLGEKYFAQKLVDYDPCVNNGNWQWAASTGCDAQPYFRIFNPWLQQKKFDPQCEYIKRWVPELKKLDPKQIHSLNKKEQIDPKIYPAPIVDHKHVAAEAKTMFKKVV